MVNYRRVICEVALLGALLAFASSAPTPDCTHTHYDQRQNGTENYRLNVDGILVAVVPGEDLFTGELDDIMELLAQEELNNKPSHGSSPSPAIELVSIDEKPNSEKPSEEKPLLEQSIAKPSEEKPQPQSSEKPSESAALSDVSLGDDEKVQKKEVSLKKQEKTKRLKNRLAAFLLPLLRKTRHH